MNPTEYIIEIQMPKDGFWAEVGRVPVEYETKEVVTRVLWLFTVRRVVVTNGRNAIRTARQEAWTHAVGRGESTRIVEATRDEDYGCVYKHEVWRDGKWKD